MKKTFVWFIWGFTQFSCKWRLFQSAKRIEALSNLFFTIFKWLEILILSYYYKFILQVVIQRDSKSFCFLRQDSFVIYKFAFNLWSTLRLYLRSILFYYSLLGRCVNFCEQHFPKYSWEMIFVEPFLWQFFKLFFPPLLSGQKQHGERGRVKVKTQCKNDQELSQKNVTKGWINIISL